MTFISASDLNLVKNLLNFTQLLSIFLVLNRNGEDANSNFVEFKLIHQNQVIQINTSEYKKKSL